MSPTNIDSIDLPVLGPRTRCVLMARDPEFIYAYWDYTQADLDRARGELKFEAEGSQLVLRIYDITLIEFDGSNANYTWDLDVGFSTKKWYVHVWQDNADYCAELGIRTSENRFIALARSNAVHTPARSMSPRNDLIWQEIRSRKESQPYVREAINKRYHSFVQKRLKRKAIDAKKAHGGRIYYLTAHDIRAYYRTLFSTVSNKGRGRRACLEDIIRMRGIVWEKVNPLLLNFAFMAPGASEGKLINQAGASESLFQAQSQAQASEGRLSKREFFFEIWTELLVYGRTESDAKVSLNQKEVKLNPDGTFSLRYALGDGEIPLKFIAESADGRQQRHIYTRVERERTISFPKMLGGSHG